MRLFVAVDITNEDILRAVTKFQQELSIPAKAIPPDQLHFTLQFLGDVEDESKITSALETISFSPFDITLRSVGVFPNENYIRVIWIGAESKELVALAQQVHEKLAPLGFKPDKPFSPHLTVFRVRNRMDAAVLKPFAGKDFGTQQVTQLKLKKSELSPGGPTYTDMLIVDGKV